MGVCHCICPCRKNRFPIWDPGNPGKIVDLGSSGSGAIFIVNIIQRLARKLRRIILLHLGITTFRFHYGRTLKLLIFMILGFSGVSMTPKPIIFHLWRPQDTPNNSRKSPSHFQKYSFWKCQHLGNPCCWKYWERQEPNNMDDPSNYFLKLLSMGSISSRRHEMEIW